MLDVGEFVSSYLRIVVMLRRISSQLSPLMLVAYLWATTCATVPHEHPPALADGPALPVETTDCKSHIHHHGHCHHGHCHPHAHGPSRDMAETSKCRQGGSCPCPGHPHHGEDDCLFCKFIAAKPLPVSQVDLIALSEPVAEIRQPVFKSPEIAVIGRPLSRGPPARG